MKHITRKFFYFHLIFWLYLSSVNCFFRIRSQRKHVPAHGTGVEKPLILTPLLNQGKIEEARAAAEVKFSEFQGVRSYSGYLTVSNVYNSNLFFWFFPSQKDYETAPVVLWLQGGPGASSLFGLFAENGPFELIPQQNCSVKLREHSWSAEHSVLYIDSPVGTGYSFTNPQGYAQNETIIGEQLYEALLQFFQLFPELQQNAFFATGESYGGKYVPAVSYAIHKNNPLARQKINLQGLAIGDGWCDPEHQLEYADYLYQIGLIDYNIKVKMEAMRKKAVSYIQQKQWIKAGNAVDAIVSDNSLFTDVTGFQNYFNYLITKDTSGIDDCIDSYVQRKDVRAAIHVGDASFIDENQIVIDNLAEDEAQSIAPWISELLSHYRTLIYNGQLDVIVAYPLTVNFLRHLNFTGADEYRTALRHKWYVGEDVAGYVKQAGNLTEVLVRNAGHMVPQDQPLWALDLITKFTHNRPLY